MLVIRQHRHVDRARVHARIIRTLASQLLEDAVFAFGVIGPLDVVLDVVRHGASGQLVPDPTVADDVFGWLGGEVLAEKVGGFGAIGGVEAGDAGTGEAVALGVLDVVRVGDDEAAWLNERERVDGEGDDGSKEEREQRRWGWMHCLGSRCG